jgi:hypothetical protein
MQPSEWKTLCDDPFETAQVCRCCVCFACNVMLWCTCRVLGTREMRRGVWVITRTLAALTLKQLGVSRLLKDGKSGTVPLSRQLIWFCLCSKRARCHRLLLLRLRKLLQTGYEG